LIDVVIGIINKDEKILMIKRTDKEENLEWSFPSGKVEDGETKEEACIREVYEETGVNIIVVKELGSRLHPNNPNVKLTYYLCEYIDGSIRILDSKEVADIKLKNRAEFERDVKLEVFAPVKKYIEENIK